MKQIVRYIDSVGDKLLFKFPGFIPTLNKNEEYVIEISPVGKDRTLAQNKYMWEIIRQIAAETGDDIISIYTIGLKEIGIKSTTMWAVEDAEEELKKKFRVVNKLEKAQFNGRDGYTYEVFYGSSTFSVSEMNKLVSFFEGKYFDLTT